MCGISGIDNSVGGDSDRDCVAFGISGGGDTRDAGCDGGVDGCGVD